MQHRKTVSEGIVREINDDGNISFITSRNEVFYNLKWLNLSKMPKNLTNCLTI